jgi:hypothetical protein
MAATHFELGQNRAGNLNFTCSSEAIRRLVELGLRVKK